MSQSFFDQFRSDTVMYNEFIAILDQHGLRDQKAVGDHLMEQARLRPERLAVEADEASITWRELHERSMQLAAALCRRGVVTGDRVAFQVSNGIDWYVGRLGIALAGAVTVLIFPKFRDKEVSHIVAETDAKVYIGDAPSGDYDNVSVVTRLREQHGVPKHVIVVGGPAPAATEAFDALLGEAANAEHFEPGRIDPDLPDQLATSSGTTGFPKIFYHVQHARKALGRILAERYGVTSEDRVLNLTPMQMGIGEPWAFWIPLLFGATAIQTSATEPAMQIEAIRRKRPTIVAAVPTQLAKMATVTDFDPAVFETVRFITNAGAPLPVSVQEIFEKRGALVVSNYGNNETGTCCVTDPNDPLESRAGCAGRVAPFAQVRIVDEQGRDVPRGVVGEIIWRNHGLPFAYYRNRALTEKLLGYGGPNPGWVHSSDGGVMDESGHIRVTGRIDDMILRGGENIFPVEIENELAKFDMVKAVAVIGMPDPIFGERVCAYVVPREGQQLTLADVKAFADKVGLAKFKWPERLEILADLPVNSSGKVLKSALRSDIEAKLKAEAGASAAQP
jgi:acyl-CoA synthetase (AMP-forming)/AMP-acid ligase II